MSNILELTDVPGTVTNIVEVNEVLKNGGFTGYTLSIHEIWVEKTNGRQEQLSDTWDEKRKYIVIEFATSEDAVIYKLRNTCL